MISFRRLLAPVTPMQFFRYVVLFWTSVAIVGVIAQFAYASIHSDSFPIQRTFSILIGWYTWIPATYLALFLVRAVPFDGAPWWQLVPVHLMSGACCAFFTSTLFAVFVMLLGLRPDTPPPTQGIGEIIGRTVAFSAATDSMIYFFILGLVTAFEFFRRLEKERARSFALSSELTQSRLSALAAQLQPHFLFNALNTVSMLVRSGRGSEAVDMIGGIGGLFRYMIDSQGSTVALREEIAFVQDYLDVEAARFGSRFRFAIHVDPAVSDAVVPYLLLQPIVENAVRHGIEPVSRDATIQVQALRQGGQLVLTVVDDGGGLEEVEAAKSGTGLANTKARLETLYGKEFSLEMSSAGTDGGCRVCVSIPFTLSESSP